MSNAAKRTRTGSEGVIPVTSGKAEDANIYNRQYLDSIHVEMRVIDSVKADLHTEIFGEIFDSPIMMPAFSHLNHAAGDGRRPMTEYAEAAAQLNVVNWVGMESDQTFEEIVSAGARTIRIIKPFADHDRIFREMEYAREHGAIAVGVDIDHIVGKDGGYDVVDGAPMGPVLSEDLKAYAEAAKLPFVAKGVLSVQDALRAEKAGCKAIVVSHHHGRIPFGIAPAQTLPEIVKALDGSGIAVFADCGINTGYDAYKLLALGADAVSVGRGILEPLMKNGREGVVNKVQDMNRQLAELMLYTGVKDTGSFDADVLYGV